MLIFNSLYIEVCALSAKLASLYCHKGLNLNPSTSLTISASFPKKTKLMQLFYLSVSFLQVTLSPLQAIPTEGLKPPLCQGLKIVEKQVNSAPNEEKTLV